MARGGSQHLYLLRNRVRLRRLRLHSRAVARALIAERRAVVQPGASSAARLESVEATWRRRCGWSSLRVCARPPNLLRRISSYHSDSSMKIRAQLVLACFLLSVLPLSVIVIYSYRSSRSALESAYRK